MVVGPSVPTALDRGFARAPHSSQQSGSNAARRRAQQRGGAVHAQAVAVEPMTERLTKSDLVQYLASGCKPRSQWRIGTEHEKLGFFKASRRRMDYGAVEHLLTGLVQRHGWQPLKEEGRIIGAELDGQSVTIEPGGQFELSGAPVATLHQTCSEVTSHLTQVKALAEEIGVEFLSIGFDPLTRFEDVPIMPKERYKIMRNYMPKVGSLGTDMMFRSTTIQVNIDFEDEQDMVEKMRIGLALQPVATALFANSPFRDGADTGYQSWRSNVWTDVDGDRCGILPFVWEEGFGFERYVEYALDVPMYFVYRGGHYLSATEKRSTFRDFCEGRLSFLPGEYPTLKDWENHLTTIFPEVRLKRYMEMRGADGGPWRIICALSAFWIGLLYHRDSQAAAYSIISDWTQEEHEALRWSVPKYGLQASFRDGTVQDLAKQVLSLAKAGLDARGLDEAAFLRPLETIATSGMTASDGLRQRFESEWGGSVLPVFDGGFTYDL